MAGKFMKVRKVVIPTLTLIAIMASTTPGAYAMTPAEATDFLGEGQTVVMEIAEVDAVTAAAPIYTAEGQKVVYAANPVSTQATSFTDLSGYDWAANAINDMASRGIVAGIGNNKYDPASNVTRQEFALMAIRAMGGNVDDLAAQASQKAATDSNYTSLDVINDTYKGNWSNNVICAIQMFPELDNTWMVSKEAWGEKATRADMAFIVMTIAEKLGNEQFSIKDGIENNIGDYSVVNSSRFKESILKAYSNGLLVGTNSAGDYAPIANASRAEAAVIMQRVVDPSTRTEVVIKAPEVTTPQEGENVGVYATYPKEGDIINGKTVTRDPASGVLGFGNGQVGGIYIGVVRTKADGTQYQIQVGEYASETYDNMIIGDKYEQRHGMTFWTHEWALIEKAAMEKLPDANSVPAGTKADVYGNIIKSGDTTTEVFWESVFVFDGYSEWASR